ncbi:predicted protein [Nematostella vectensis]|uniref:G-protein coupled receptors family 1 profile domain-containing protein n=1 Tax=Nematostella vectensis TaxID=45351 RepID=A7RNT4_NEMVE|nr:predicted protein [Nematostella vectensis]|eukprot:XP_001638972.1 predicted protein [Nematostella vectensis]
MADNVYLEVSFAIIAVLAICSNATFCIVLLRDKRLLNTACNVLLFSLALTDMCTGLSLFFTPAYVVAPQHFTVPLGVIGDFFCRIIFSQCLVFTLGIISVYTLTFMAVERWYKAMFAKNRKYLYVAMVWLWSCLLNAPHALEMELTTHNASEPTCEWVTAITNKNTRLVVAVGEFLLKFLLPVLVTCATFISLQMTVHKPGCQFLRRNGKAGMRLLRMCTFTAFALAACWAPNQLYYILFKFGHSQLNVPAHHVTVILCMFNSCINPWIYCATNRTYRKKFTALARAICFRGPQVNCDVTTSGSPMEGSTGTGVQNKPETISTTDRPLSSKMQQNIQYGSVITVLEPEKRHVPAGAESLELEIPGVTSAGNNTTASFVNDADGTELQSIESPSPTIEETRT